MKAEHATLLYTQFFTLIVTVQEMMERLSKIPIATLERIIKRFTFSLEAI